MPEAGTPAVEPEVTPTETGAADQAPPGEAPPDSAPATTQEGEPRGEGKGTRRFERRIARLQREAADARAEARLIREQMDRLSTPRVQGDDQPKREDYLDDAAYIRALVRWEADTQREQDNARRSQEDVEREAEREVGKARETFEKQRKSAIKRHDDFEDVLEDLLSDKRIAEHPGIGGAIAQSDVGAELAYWLGTHPDDAESIADMTPFAAAVRLGEVAAQIRLELSPKGKPASRAPEPIKPLAGGESGGDQGPSENDGMADWIAKRRAQIKARRAR